VSEANCYRLKDKVAIVTGGASGIGLATVERFVREGARVVFCDLAPGAGAELEARLGPAKTRWHHTRRPRGGPNDGEVIAARLGSRATFVPCDITDRDQLPHVIDTAVSTYGRLDIVFNCAGIGGTEGFIVDASEEIFDRVIEVNLKSVWRAIKYAAPKMMEHGGSIINTGSTAALRGYPGVGAYSASKAGVLQLTQVAALELAKYRIRVNAVCPGAIRTPLLYDSPLAEGRVDPESRTAIHLKNQPLPIVGEPEFIADAVLWLASDESIFVTGQAIAIEGGKTIEAEPHNRGSAVVGPLK
jgi:NAD(P)-dependent dehydrogenase (short-subunit alcohol dehydrogenase family)